MITRNVFKTTTVSLVLFYALLIVPTLYCIYAEEPGATYPYYKWSMFGERIPPKITFYAIEILEWNGTTYDPPADLLRRNKPFIRESGYSLYKKIQAKAGTNSVKEWFDKIAPGHYKAVVKQNEIDFYKYLKTRTLESSKDVYVVEN